MLTLKAQFFLSPTGQWVSKYKALLLGAALLFLGFFGWQCSSLLRSADVKERRVEELFADWKKDPQNEALYRDLRKSAKNLSGPHSIHAQIAQVLLSLGLSDEAEGLARVSLERLRMIAPIYAEFADISLLISKESYQEALERSVSLKEAMDEKETVLYGKNLVRIAFLQQQLGNRAGERAAWDELEEFPNSRDLIRGLAHRESDFQAYLEERRKLL